MVTQGSVDGPVTSANSIANSSDVTFANGDGDLGKVSYVNIALSNLIFMDDIFRMEEGVVSAQKANVLMEEMMEKKSLDLNLKKSGFLVMGSKGPRNKMMKEVEKSPLKL